MGWDQLVRARLGLKRPSLCVGSFRQRPLRGGEFHDSGWQRSKSRCQMEREQLVGAGVGIGGGHGPYPPSVYALAVWAGDLYVGGHFTTAGGKVSGHTARAVLGDAPGYNQLTGILLSGGGLRFSYVGNPATS